MSTPVYRSRPGGSDIRPARAEARRLNDFIWLSEGLSNSYLIVTRDGRIVINTGISFEAPIHKRSYDAIDTGPLRYILLTQGHVDHVGGVDLFRESGTEVVAQAGNAAHQATDARLAQFRARRSSFAFAEVIGRADRYVRENLGAEVPPQSCPVPTISFEDRHRFELGGLEVELISTPGGETRDSLVVWLPQHGICFTGNLFSALFGHFPNLVTIRGDRYREALDFIESTERVLALEPTLLLPGHHGPIEGRELIREELTRLRDAVRYVHDATVQGMNEGKDVDTLMREIRLPPELEVGEGYGRISWSVRAIWENYAGWFQHRSASELYPQPVEPVQGELVRMAGGAETVAARAMQHLAAGDALRALDLAEAALAADSEHADARAASLAAHRHLLAARDNFWESAFLEHRIRKLEKPRG